MRAVIARFQPDAPRAWNQAMRCALMTGNETAWNVLRSAGGDLAVVGEWESMAGAAETLVYATCRMRGKAREEAVSMLVGKTTRCTEIEMRRVAWGRDPAKLVEWAGAMLAEADVIGVREFVRWVGPLFDSQPDWRESIHSAAAVFANMVRPDEYLAITTAYGSRITPSPLAAMIGLCDADAEAAIQWLVDCRPEALTVGELVQLAEWSKVAAMACDVRGPKFARRPDWWRAMATTVLLCCQRTEQAPPELARHICSFVVSSTAGGQPCGEPQRNGTMM